MFPEAQETLWHWDLSEQKTQDLYLLPPSFTFP